MKVCFDRDRRILGLFAFVFAVGGVFFGALCAKSLLASGQMDAFRFERLELLLSRRSPGDLLLLSFLPPLLIWLLSCSDRTVWLLGLFYGVFGFSCAVFLSALYVGCGRKGIGLAALLLLPQFFLLFPLYCALPSLLREPGGGLRSVPARGWIAAFTAAAALFAFLYQAFLLPVILSKVENL